MAHIDKQDIERILNEGKIYRIFLQYGECDNYKRCNQYSRFLTDFVNCGLGTLIKIYSGQDIVFANRTITQTCSKTLDMVGDLDLEEVNEIVMKVDSQNILNLDLLKNDIDRVREIVKARIDALLDLPLDPADYHIKISNKVVLLGVIMDRYCDMSYQIIDKPQTVNRLKIDDTFSLLFDEDVVPLIDGYICKLFSRVKEERNYKTVPFYQNNWLRQRYRGFRMNEKVYEKLHPDLKECYSIHDCSNNQFVVDYLFYELLKHDVGRVMSDMTIESFRQFARISNMRQ